MFLIGYLVVVEVRVALSLAVTRVTERGVPNQIGADRAENSNCFEACVNGCKSAATHTIQSGIRACEFENSPGLTGWLSAKRRDIVKV